MYSKRGEYFRYEFEHPLDATFKIIEINGVKKASKAAEAKIKNISPHGLKMLTSLHIQFDHVESLIVEIHFRLDENNPLVVHGEFVWQKKEVTGYSYGINLKSTVESEKKIIEELKKFSKQTVDIKRKNEK